jgi:hypothetical protein
VIRWTQVGWTPQYWDVALVSQALKIVQIGVIIIVIAVPSKLLAPAIFAKRSVTPCRFYGGGLFEAPSPRCRPHNPKRGTNLSLCNSSLLLQFHSHDTSARFIQDRILMQSDPSRKFERIVPPWNLYTPVTAEYMHTSQRPPLYSLDPQPLGASSNLFWMRLYPLYASSKEYQICYV